MAQSNLAAVPPGGELKARESLDRRTIGLDSAYVAQGDAGPASLEQRADTPTEPREVCAADGATDCKGDRLRRGRGHAEIGPLERPKLIVAVTDDFRPRAQSKESTRPHRAERTPLR
jgi:hypothetical protein